MRDLACKPHFVAESVQGAFGQCNAIAQEFERNVLFEDQVVRLIDLSHTSFADAPANAVSLGKHSSRSELAIVGIRGRDCARRNPFRHGYCFGLRGQQQRCSTGATKMVAG